MAKKTVIGRACKLFVSTSDDAGVYGEESPEWQESEPSTQAANAKEAVFVELPKAAPAPEEVAEAAQEEIPVDVPEDIPEDLANEPEQVETPLGEDFFNL